MRRAADARYGAGTGQSLSGGINNTRGEWFENILKLIFWNVAMEFDKGGKTVNLETSQCLTTAVSRIYMNKGQRAT